MRPPFETFKGAICKGSYALGSACGHCDRCTWERAQMVGAQIPGKPPAILSESYPVAAFQWGRPDVLQAITVQIEKVLGTCCTGTFRIVVSRVEESEGNSQKAEGNSPDLRPICHKCKQVIKVSEPFLRDSEGVHHFRPEQCLLIEPRLGCATTKQLIDELAARAEVSEVNGETWPNYKTVACKS